MESRKAGANTAYLRKLLKHAKRQYAERKKVSEQQVVRREYYSGEAIDPRPFHFERVQKAKGRRLKHPAPQGCEYGFDSKGRVVVARHAPDKEEPAAEEFFCYYGDVVESATYDVRKGNRVLYATLQRFRRGRIVECDVLDFNPSSEFDERYVYKQGRLTMIHATSMAGHNKATGLWDIQYDRSGRYHCVRRFYDDYDQYFVVHWNPETAPKLDELMRRIHKRLAELIPEVVRKRRVQEPAYCVALAYDFENDPLPPYVGIGLASEREAWVRTHGKGAKGLLWNPAEYRLYEDGTLNLCDKSLDEDCDIFCQLLNMRSDTWSAQKLLNGVTAALNRRDWSRLLPVTEDFIVYAVDLEGAHLSANVRAGVPAAKLKRLRKQKML